jgi:hypothetical protein
MALDCAPLGFEPGDAIRRARAGSGVARSPTRHHQFAIVAGGPTARAYLRGTEKRDPDYGDATFSLDLQELLSDSRAFGQEYRPALSTS